MARARHWLTPLALGTAPLVFLAVLFVWPVYAIVARGLRAPQGLSHIFDGVDIGHLLWFTLAQAAASTALTIAVGLPIAWLTTRVALPGRAVLRVIVTVPFVLPTVVVGVAFRTLLAPGGPLAFLHLDGTVWAILLAHTFFNVAVVARTVGGVWAHVDPRAAAAARTLGAGPVRVFCTVTVPALRTALLSAASVVFLFCATSFGVVLILGGTRFRTIETEIYLQTVSYFDLHAAAGLSIVQLLAVVLTLLVGSRARRARERQLALTSSASVLRSPRGGQWFAVGGILVMMAVLLLVPPIAMIVRSLRLPTGRWTLDAYRALLGHTSNTVAAQASSALVTSLRTSVDATLIAVVMGLLAAVALSRGTGRIASLADTAMMLPLGVSAVTVGFGYLITLGDLPTVVRDSPIVVAAAQALIATPLVIRTALPGLRAVDQGLREAAALLGASPWRTWWTVDFPLAARSFAAAIGFAFVVTLGEFGATSFLARPDHPTLPVLIGQLINRPGTLNATAAMASATLLMVLTAVVVAIVEAVRVGDMGEF